MKTVNIRKLWNIFRKDSKHCPVIEQSNKGNYLADIYYDSGLDKDTFRLIYVRTLDLFFSDVDVDCDRNEFILGLRDAVRSRRYFYLPNNVEA